MLIIMCNLKSFDDVATPSEAVASLRPSIHFLNSFCLLSTESRSTTSTARFARASAFDPTSP